MGLLRVACAIVNPANLNRGEIVSGALVDTGSEFSWVPTDILRSVGIAPVKRDVQFVMANGQSIVRSIGYGIIRAAGFETIDEIVFGVAGDLTLLGARTLEGFGATVDPGKKRLVASGPHLAAAGF